MQGNGANKPDLAHSSDHTGNSAAESKDGGKAGRKLGGLIVMGCDVSVHCALVDEMVAESNALIDGEPVA